MNDLTMDQIREQLAKTSSQRACALELRKEEGFFWIKLAGPSVTQENGMQIAQEIADRTRARFYLNSVEPGSLEGALDADADNLDERGAPQPYPQYPWNSIGDYGDCHYPGGAAGRPAAFEGFASPLFNLADDYPAAAKFVSFPSESVQEDDDDNLISDAVYQNDIFMAAQAYALSRLGGKNAEPIRGIEEFKPANALENIACAALEELLRQGLSYGRLKSLVSGACAKAKAGNRQ